MRLRHFLILLFFAGSPTLFFAQEYDDVYIEPINDPSADGQRFFVEDLLDLAGYVPENIQIYQTLPNKARVFRVKLDSVNGGFVFVRWDKTKKENYVANKMIDPGVYYNLKAAEEIMRIQTEKASFSADDISIQAGDQFKISGEDINGLRGEYDKKIEAQKKSQSNLHKQQLERARRKAERKRSKN